MKLESTKKTTLIKLLTKLIEYKRNWKTGNEPKREREKAKVEQAKCNGQQKNKIK